jgi:uncharacterized protein YbjQ (UPF0145 family)
LLTNFALAWLAGPSAITLYTYTPLHGFNHRLSLMTNIQLRIFNLRFTLLLLAAAVSGCATQTITKIPDGMTVASESAVKDCEFKGDVHGTSMLYGVFVESALSKARQQAFNQAKDIGANTVVWQPFQTQSGATSVHGNAYFCK